MQSQKSLRHIFILFHYKRSCSTFYIYNNSGHASNICKNVWTSSVVFQRGKNRLVFAFIISEPSSEVVYSYLHGYRGFHLDILLLSYRKLLLYEFFLWVYKYIFMEYWSWQTKLNNIRKLITYKIQTYLKSIIKNKFYIKNLNSPVCANRLKVHLVHVQKLKIKKYCRMIVIFFLCYIIHFLTYHT